MILKAGCPDQYGLSLWKNGICGPAKKKRKDSINDDLKQGEGENAGGGGRVIR